MEPFDEPPSEDPEDPETKLLLKLVLSFADLAWIVKMSTNLFKPLWSVYNL